MSDNAWLSYPPDPVDYRRWVIELEHSQPLPSCLGAGCCPECGRPVKQCECEEVVCSDR
jgi:hypothetical protein